MNKKHFTGYVEKDSIDEKRGILSVAVATDFGVDRDGEIVDPSGLNFDNFLKNPVLLYAHDYRSDPIGKVLEIKRDGSRVLFTPQFALDINPKANMYFQMFKEGILNAFSIGFIAKEYEDRQNGDGSRTRVFTQSELLEISAVPVPSNPRALALVRGIKSADGKGVEEVLGEGFIKEMESAVKAPEMSDQTKKLIELKGASMAMLALLGAKCGVEIPEADREAAYNHVKGLLEAAGKSVPTYDLVEAQVLKDVSLATEKEIVLRVSGIEASEFESLKATVAGIEKSLADNGDRGSKGITVGELLRHKDFHPAVLKAVDKALGVSLRDHNRSGDKR